MIDKMNKAVIFDMDGVIVDTGPYHKQSWYDLAEKHGWRMSEEFFAHTFGMQNYQIIPQMTDDSLSREQIDEAGLWKEIRFRELIAGQIAPLAGVLEIITELKSQGFKLAVGSSGPRMNVEMVLRGSGVKDYYDAIIAGEDVRNGKPAPDTFLAAAKAIGISPDRCVVIEDAVHGVEAAKTAGMKVVAVTTTNPAENLKQADLVVDSLGELSAVDFEGLLD
ncbi:MAG: HAD family phosphatase [Sedimentisphaerales bacterium]|nr:HAD family phosphatase [Sedimentisphaerales bacterium]